MFPEKELQDFWKAVEQDNWSMVRKLIWFGDIYHILIRKVFHPKSEEILLDTIASGEMEANALLDEDILLLIEMVERGSIALVDKLIERGANLTDGIAEWALSRAALYGYKHIFYYLLPLSDSKQRQLKYQELKKTLQYHKYRNFFCYAEAVYCACHQLISNLIFTKINGINFTTNSQIETEAALWMACYWGLYNQVKKLLQAEVNCNFQRDYRDLISYPIPHMLGRSNDCLGLSPAKANYQALTPLMVAVAKGSWDVKKVPDIVFNYLKIINLLIARGANLNIQDRDGYTPLMWSAFENCTQIAEVLIEAGTQLDLVNNAGYSALTIAQSLDHKEMVEMLVNAGALENRADWVELVKAVENREISNIQKLLEMGVSSNACDYLGNRVLKLAIANQQEETCRLLIQAGAELESIDIYEDESALLCSIRQQQREIIWLLLQASINLNFQGKAWGETALIEAVRYGDLESVKLLVDRGADVNIRDNFERTALDYADMRNHLCSTDISTEIGVFLLENGAFYGHELVRC